jgi:hypothetical protein
MTRNSTDPLLPYDFAAKVIEIEAGKLARRHDIDTTRVRSILAHTATDYYGRPILLPVPGHDNLSEGLQFHPSLEEALAYLPSEVALSTFEETDRGALSNRARLIDYLADPTSPSNTRLELAALLEAFSLHLKQDRDVLVRTGYPRTRFDASPWLEWHLTLLSPTKFPASALPLGGSTMATQVDHPSLVGHQAEPTHNNDQWSSDDDDNSTYSYAWTREPVGPVWSEDGAYLIRSLDHPIPSRRCPYEEAPLMHGLSRDTAKDLVNDRAKLLELKLDVVSVCARCLRSGDIEALWPSVLRILVDTVLWQDVQRYLDIEETYWRAGIGECVVPSYSLRAPRDVPGTLSTLLTVVGHVEKELRLGTFDRTMGALKPALLGTGVTRIESYFLLVGHHERPAIDAALDGFLELEGQERSFWEEYRHRVNAALETELREEVVVRVPVRRGLGGKFEPYLRTFAEWQAMQMEATGNLSPLQLSSPAESPLPQRNIFRLEGQFWTIAYEGQTIRLKDLKGLRYLAVLLADPHREFHVLDLVRRVEGTPPIPDRPQDLQAREMLTDLNLSDRGFGDAGNMIDDETRTSLQQRLQDLPEEIEEKLELGNVDGADRLRTEQEVIVSYLAASHGLGAQSRKASSSVDRARVNITKRINDARGTISAHHPVLGHHLRSVKTGTYCQYAPDFPTDWQL